MSTFDDVIEQTGGIGRYQIILILMFFCLVLPTGFNTLLPLFILTTPKHRCAIPGLNNDTYAVQSAYHQELINEWIPFEKDDGELEMSQCKVFGFENMSWTEGYGRHESNRSQRSCDRWVFDKEYFGRSIIEELDILCDMKQFRSHANSAMMAGKFVSALAEGIISDRFGRRVSLLIFITIMTVSSFVNAFTYNLPSLIAFRFLSGLGTTSSYMSAYLLTLEFLSPRYRQAFNVFAGMSWLASAYIVTLFAYFIRDFQTLCLTTAVPTVFLLSYFWLLPESARWLVLHGRVKDARTMLQKIATVNGKHFPENTFDRFVEQLQIKRMRMKAPLTDNEDLSGYVHVQRDNPTGKDDEPTPDEQCNFRDENIFVLMRHRRLAIRVMIVFWNWCANSMTYYGILFNVQNLIGSIYINFTITNTVDLLVNLATLYVVDKFGRKKTYTFSFFFSAVACLSVIIPFEVASKHDLSVSVAVLSMLGRAGVSAAFNIMYLYSSEMFPTTTRGTVLGASSMCSRFGTLAAPYIADLGLLVGGSFATMLPLAVFGGLGFTATVTALFLPETLGVKLPSTVDDALDIG